MTILRDFKSIDRNARNVLLFEPMFGIPFGFCAAYAALYRAGLGLSAQQIGLLSSTSAAASMFISLFAGHICDRLGRRKAGLIFGLTGFALPHLIYGLSHSFVGFLLGVVVGGMWTIEATAWNCMVVDDTPADGRVNLFRWVNIFVMVSALFTPIAGVFVSRYGVVSATRGFYLFAALCMTLMFTIRYLITEETGVGAERMRATQSHSIRESLDDYRKATVALLGNRAALCFFLAQQAIGFHSQSTGVYFALYVRNALGVGASWVSAFPAVGSAVNLAAFWFLIPRLSPVGEKRSLASGAAIYIAGAALLVLCPRGWFPLLVGSTMLTALGSAVIQPFLSAAWNNAIPDDSRAKVVSLTWILGSLICMPAGLIAGQLFTRSPRLPFVLGVGLYVVTLGLLIAAYSGKSHRSEPPLIAAPGADS